MSEPFLVNKKQPIGNPRQNAPIKQKISNKWATTKVVSKNVAEFIDAACLAIVSGFAIYNAHFGNLKRIYSDILMFAGLVIALQAFVLLVKHFNK